MANRKPWELTDLEVFVAYRRPFGTRALATAAARKALEWAADECYGWSTSSAVRETIRAALKELSDG